MTTRATPWDEIGNPDVDYNVRLVAGSKAIPLYWGKDSAGRCLFVVELEGDHAKQFRKEGTSINGIDVDLRSLDGGGRQGLVLTLEKHIDKDLFMRLCDTLIASLQPTTDSATALAVALAHIKRWKAFFAGKKRGVLSAEEVRGLFCELLFLRSLYQDHLDERVAIEAWCGPDGTHHDFIFGNKAVEIKSLSGKERNTIIISSEDQLESLCDDLFLLVYRLNDMPDSDRSLSLNGLVRSIEKELTDATAIEEFSVRLASYGYVEMREYDRPEFFVAARYAFHVTDDFPRLVRSNLPGGIVRLRYEIELEKVTEFQCDPERIWEG